MCCTAFCARLSSPCGDNNKTKRAISSRSQALLSREGSYGKCGVKAQDDVKTLAPGTFYVTAVDDEGRREYERMPLAGAEEAA